MVNHGLVDRRAVHPHRLDLRAPPDLAGQRAARPAAPGPGAGRGLHRGHAGRHRACPGSTGSSASSSSWSAPSSPTGGGRWSPPPASCSPRSTCCGPTSRPSTTSPTRRRPRPATCRGARGRRRPAGRPHRGPRRLPQARARPHHPVGQPAGPPGRTSRRAPTSRPSPPAGPARRRPRPATAARRPGSSAVSASSPPTASSTARLALPHIALPRDPAHPGHARRGGGDPAGVVAAAPAPGPVGHHVADHAHGGRGLRLRRSCSGSTSPPRPATHHRPLGGPGRLQRLLHRALSRAAVLVGAMVGDSWLRRQGVLGPEYHVLTLSRPRGR